MKCLQITGGLVLAALFALLVPGHALGGVLFKKQQLYVVPIQPAAAPSPVVYQAPATYTTYQTQAVGAAPLIYAAPAATTTQVQAAPTQATYPAIGSAPTSNDGVRLSQALRRALYDDMRRELQQGGGMSPGQERASAIRDVKERARELYADYLGDDDVTGADLTRDEIALINQYVDYLISESEGPTPTFPQPTYSTYPTGYSTHAPGVIIVPSAPAPAPAGYLVPIYPHPHHGHHPHFRKH